MVFADVGANVGQFTLLAAQSVGPAGHVFAFEPESHNYQQLQRNIQLNQLGNVEAVRMALADFDGQAPLYVHRDQSDLNAGVHSLVQKPEWQYSDTDLVQVRTFDQVFKDAQRLDIVKVDVEGAELSVFRGGQITLRKFKPIIVFEAEERHARAFGNSTPELKQFVCSMGYECFTISTPNWYSDRVLGLVPVELSRVEDYSMIVALPDSR